MTKRRNLRCVRHFERQTLETLVMLENFERHGELHEDNIKMYISEIVSKVLTMTEGCCTIYKNYVHKRREIRIKCLLRRNMRRIGLHELDNC
jgi:hypothetical protein